MRHFTIEEVKPKIFHFNFKDQYQLAMHFLRYQEFYESPNPKFRNHGFTILDFMEWYSKAFGNGSFTYPLDWVGFNVPNKVFERAIEKSPEENKYDTTMIEAYFQCKQKAGAKFYIIGSVGDKTSQFYAMKHEVAHGFFYLNPTYKKEMTKLVKALKPRLRNDMFAAFKKIGYTPQVYVDECQAYFSTGIPDRFGLHLKGEDQPFIDLYSTYYKGQSND